MILNIHQLRAFYTAAEYKSITLAAQELMVTPPAITIQIKQLEETLGIRLMFRDRNSIRLTEVGGTVYRKSKAIFERIKEMENFLEDISTAKSGVLRMGCPPAYAKYVMPRMIAEFKKTYPEIRIVLDQGSSSYLVKSIVNHTNELAVIRVRPDEKRLKVTAVVTEPIVLVTALGDATIASDEISVTQLSEIPLILSQEGSATREVVLEYLRRFRITPFIVMESASVDLLKEMVAQGNGAGFLPSYAIQEELERKKLRLVRIVEGSPNLESGIGYLHKRLLSPAAWAFLRILDRVEELIPNKH